MADFLTELRTWLLVQDDTLPLYLGKLPSAPVEAAALYEVGGEPDQYSPVEEFRFRIISRGENRGNALDRANTIFDLLRSAPAGGAHAVDLTSWHVYVVSVRRPQQIGLDENARPMFAFDCEANLRPIS